MEVPGKFQSGGGGSSATQGRSSEGIGGAHCPSNMLVGKAYEEDAPLGFSKTVFDPKK